MAHDLSVELAKLLDQYDENCRALEQRKQRVKTDEDAFQHGFVDLRNRVVRPVFEATGVILKARGHDFKITEEEFGEERSGKSTEAAISIQVMPAGMDRPSQGSPPFPSLSFITRRYNKTVCVLASNATPKPSGAAGSRGDYQLAQVNTEMVQAELLQLIAGFVNA